jgi:hypothetical protein
MVGKRRQHLELVFGRPSFELYRVEIIGVEKKFHQVSVGKAITCNTPRFLQTSGIMRR